MENTNNASTQGAAVLLAQAKRDLMANMETRSIAAIIWDNATAGFHYLPVATQSDGKVLNVTGIYSYEGELYLIDEDCQRADINHFYDHDTEVKPTVVCLSPSVASGDLGDPTRNTGFTLEATMEEWLAIADCYFESLAES